MSNRTFHLLAAYKADNDEALAGIPDLDGLFGTYTGKHPQDAFSKAYSNVLKYIKRYRREGSSATDPTWFMDYDDNEELVLVGYEPDSGKMYAYFAYRHEAPQSVGGRARKIFSEQADGSFRERNYMWRNKLIPLRVTRKTTKDSENVQIEPIEDAIERHERRSGSSQRHSDRSRDGQFS